MTARPHRTRKADRLLAPDARNEERRCDYAVAPFDRVARQMDDAWGIDRLPSLVSTETAAKYGRLMADLQDAINKADAMEVERLATIGCRALERMDAEAKAAGHDRMPADFWEYDLDGFRFAVMPDNARWPEVKKLRPDLVLFTMREAALALKAMNAGGIIKATKDAFPGAQVTNVTPMKFTNTEMEDEIPW